MLDSKPAQHPCRHDAPELRGKSNRLWYFLSLTSLIAVWLNSSFANADETLSKRIEKIIERYNCHLDEKHYDKNEVGTKTPYFWGVVKGANPQASVVFWCYQKVGEQEIGKLVIHVETSVVKKFQKESALSRCPNQILNVIGHSTGVWIENDAIYTGYEDGIYFYCKDGKWIESEWH